MNGVSRNQEKCTCSWPSKRVEKKKEFYKMKRVSIFSVLFLTAALAQAWATTAPPTSCDGVNLGSILATAAPTFSCQVGDKVFSNFTYIDSSTGGVIAVPATGVTVDTLGPAGSGADVLNGNIGLEFNSSWTAQTNQTNDGTIGFTVTVVGSSNLEIEDFGLAQISGVSVTGSALATVTEKGCGPSPCTPGRLGVLTFDNGTPSTSQTVNDTIFTPVSSVSVLKDIVVNGGTTSGSFAGISLVQDTFSQTGVPEPATMLLVGSVLCGIAAIRRRSARS
jgi:hypothetical protein